MGMSTSIQGFAPPDAQWKKMKAIYDACEAADQPVPENVEKFFNYEEPDEAGVEVDLEKAGDAIEWNGDGASGYEVDLSKVPSHVKKIRFYNSW